MGRLKGILYGYFFILLLIFSGILYSPVSAIKELFEEFLRRLRGIEL